MLWLSVVLAALASPFPDVRCTIRVDPADLSAFHNSGLAPGVMKDHGGHGSR